jgi:hypothetical protein
MYTNVPGWRYVVLQATQHVVFQIHVFRRERAEKMPFGSSVSRFPPRYRYLRLANEEKASGLRYVRRLLSSRKYSRDSSELKMPGESSTR